jgi:hypothetical protein
MVLVFEGEFELKRKGGYVSAVHEGVFEPLRTTNARRSDMGPRTEAGHWLISSQFQKITRCLRRPRGAVRVQSSQMLERSSAARCFYPVRPFKRGQDRAVIQWAAIGAALIYEVPERFRHDLHRFDFRLELQFLFEG